jgi:glycosyltransferase involved in cell wall biosynthesis
MACGLPVVATAVGGLVGTIRDGESGLLVPPGDADLLADRLLRLLCDQDLRTAIGAAARRGVEQEFSWQRSVEVTLGVYREVLGCPEKA